MWLCSATAVQAKQHLSLIHIFILGAIRHFIVKWAEAIGPIAGSLRGLITGQMTKHLGKRLFRVVH